MLPVFQCRLLLAFTCVLLAAALANKDIQNTEKPQKILECEEKIVDPIQCGDGAVVRTTGEIFVVPDIHGDLKGFIRALKLGNVVDEDLTWIYGRNVVVQTGDIFDRGPDTAEILTLLFDLMKQAQKNGGCLVSLMGNHELMNLYHDFRYASVLETRGFGGINNRREEMGMDSFLGQFLRNQRLSVVVEQVNSLDLEASTPISRTLFTHAGLSSNTLQLFDNSLDELNSFSKRELFKESGQHLMSQLYSNKKAMQVFTDPGPLWTRFFSYAPGQDSGSICSDLTNVLKTLKADRMIVGHTVQSDHKPSFRCKNKLIMADVGMSQFYGGGAHFVKIHSNGTVSIVS